MKTKSILGVLLLVFLFSQLLYSQVQCVSLNGNNIKSYFVNTGLFDCNKCSDSAGFEWPKGSGKFAVRTAGLNIAGYGAVSLLCQAHLRKESIYPVIALRAFRIQILIFIFIKFPGGDNSSNPDWANWGQMVPYGAPFVDVNLNGTYEPAIDTPGVKGAAQTIFVCLTDGFSNMHSSTEGFGGGTPPLC